MDSSAVRQEAGRWLMRREAGEWSPEDEAALKAWLDSSTAHTVQFIRLEAAWKQSGRLNSLAAGVPPRTVPLADHWDNSPFFDGPPFDRPLFDRIGRSRKPKSRTTVRRRRWWLGAVAAGVMAVVVGVLSWRFWMAEPVYTTPVGGLASVPMTDGSKITLNTASTVRVSITQTGRQVELRQGEAFFEVARDPARPFVVMVGDERVEALGTAFSVRKTADGVLVAVTEGLVRVGGPQGRVLAAGSVARTDGASVVVREMPLPEVQESLSWRSGYLVFEGTPLGEAIEEFNRYNELQIVLGDASIASIRLTGKFEATRYDAFVRLVEEGFPVRSQRRDNRIVLSPE